MRLGAIAGGLIGLHAGGAEGMVEGAELGALAVAERDAGLSIDRMQELADFDLRRQRHGDPRHRAPLGGEPPRPDRGCRRPDVMQAMIAPDALAIWLTNCA